MPPKRRSTGPATTRSQQQQQRAQSTISFGKGGANRVTKSSAQLTQRSKKDPAILDITPATAEPELSAPTTAEAAIEEQAEAEVDTLNTVADPLAQGAGTRIEDVLGGRAPKSEVGATGGKSGMGWVSDEGLRARKVSDSQVKKYWREKEKLRKAPRVHQEGLSMGEKILREFDMSGQYGPCIGIARLKRWKRANMLSLNPPIEVLAVLLKGVDEGDSKIQRAHVDELLSSRFVET